MAHRNKPRGKTKTSSEIPPKLRLAEKFCKKLGRKYEYKEAIVGNETKILLFVYHGGNPIFVSQEKDSIIIFIRINIPDEVKKISQKLEEELTERILFNLKRELSSHERTGFSLIPININKLSELEGFVVQQQIVISEKDPSSINRFADAIQEVVTVTARALLILNLLPRDETGQGEMGVITDNTAGMYM